MTTSTVNPTDESPIQSRDDEFYRALLDRDPAYQGSYYVGVKTTGIFCISTCRARKPKRENVEFFEGLKPVLAAGYRPCKVCRPVDPRDEHSETIETVMELIKSHPQSKVSDAMLRERGLSPTAVRTWFKRHYGMTFHAYHRMLRINLAFQEIESGGKTIDAAMDHGFDSLSGFAYAFKQQTGRAPSQAALERQIVMERIATPLGPMFVAATDRGICLLEFTDRRMLETELADLQKRLKARIVFGDNDHTRQLKTELNEYFAGQRQDFNVVLDAPGTDFQRQVWNALLKVPFGETTTYGRQAQRIDRPSAVRAVASANGANRISIVIPCHRVIGKDGQLVGYGGGLERKRWLLAHERGVAAVSP
ncbi:MAG: methylated-DNA--[protein]-cysteine S-methyltransferase [Pseudomonadota bacterium]